MANNPVIRTAKLDDVPFLMDGLTNLIRHIQTGSRDAYFVELEAGYEQSFTPWINKLLNDTNAQILVALLDLQPVGDIVGQIKQPFLPFSKIKHVGEIFGCWIKPEARGQGIAKKLVSGIEPWFKHRHIVYKELHYIVGNTEAEIF